MPQEVITISGDILGQQVQVPGATGEFAELLSIFALAAKIIAREVSRLGLRESIGAANSQGAQDRKATGLDTFTHRLICDLLAQSGHVCVMVSEESEAPVELPDNCARGNYVVLFDPLDGSSNIEFNASVGTIFSVQRRITAAGKPTLGDCLQAGDSQVCAGYVVYGPSTMLVYTIGRGVHGLTLDPLTGEFLLSHESLTIPVRGNYYSVNEGATGQWADGIAAYINSLKAAARPSSLRYVGTLVADFHRILLAGGIFLYPANTHYPEGRLRLLYEAAPLAFISEQAGGRATTGCKRILDLEPKTLHQRVPLIIGSRGDVLTAERFIREARSKMA